MSAALRTIPAEVAELLRSGRGVFTLGEAVAFGVSADRVQRLAGAGLLERVGRGAFASRAALTTTDEWTAHWLRARGFVAGREDALVAGWSAVAIRGLRTVGRPPSAPTAVRPIAQGRGSTRTRYGVIRSTASPPNTVAATSGVRS